MEEKSSGVSPNPPTENESILEDILEIMESTPIRNPVIVLKKKKKERSTCNQRNSNEYLEEGRKMLSR